MLTRLRAALLRLFTRRQPVAGDAFLTAADTLEPYCGEPVLQERIQGSHLHDADRKAIHKIGARYGAEL